MKTICFIFLFCLICPALRAQHEPIILSGEVQYDFKVNQYERAKKILGDQIADTRYNAYVQSLANNKFVNTAYVLMFNNELSSYERIQKDVPTNNFDFIIDMPTVFTLKNLGKDSVYIEKNVAGELIKIKDKQAPIIWKFTDERMNILGYECRRANGLLADSVYIVAFYCPNMPISSGPSVFGGLPGLILGISLPHDNINIFATKLTIQTTSVTQNKFGVDRRSVKSFIEYKEFMKQTFATDKKQQDRFEFNVRTLYL